MGNLNKVKAHSFRELLHQFTTGIPTTRLARLSEQTKTNTNITLALILVILVVVEIQVYVPWLYVWALVHAGFIITIRFRSKQTQHSLELDSDTHLTRSGLRRAVFYAGFSGGLWGSLTVFLPSIPPDYQIAIILAIGGMAAGASSTLSAVLQVAIVFILACCLPVIIYQLSLGYEGIALAFVFTVFMFAMIGTSQIVYQGVMSLRRSEEQYRVLLKEIPDPISIHRENQVLFMNRAALEILGYQWAEASVIPVMGFIHPGDHHVVLRRQAAFARGESPPPEEIRYLKKDGSFVIGDVHGYATTFGESTAQITIYRDVTAKKNAQENARRTEVLFRGLVEEMPEAVIVVHAEQVLYTNQAALDLFGYEWEEAKTIPVLDYIHPDDHPVVARRQVEFDQGEIPAAEEIRYLKRDGSTVLCEVYGYPTTYEGLEARTVILRDVSVRKQAEEADAALRRKLEKRVLVRTKELQQSEEQVRLLLNSTAEAIYGLDLDGRCTFCNPACLAALGFESEKDLLGNNMHEFIHYRRADGSHYPNSDCKIYQGFREGQRSHADDEVLCRNDGTSFPAEYWSYPIRRDDKVVGSVITFLDITDRKNIELGLRESEERLRQVQKMEVVGQLAGGVAHDFNNLLTVIHGYCDLNLSSLDPVDPLYHDLTEIKNASARATTLTRQLLAFSRKQILKPEAIDLGEIVVGMKNMLQRLIGEHIEFTVCHDPNLKMVRADPGQIEQVVMNLVINARDVMPLGGNLTLEFRNVALDNSMSVISGDLPSGDYVVLSISDTGTGIDEEIQTHIFEPFYTTKALGKGTGLGLATVFGIVSQSGGGLVVKSVLGEGSTFDVYLPQINPSMSNVHKSTNLFAPIEGRETILVTEDESSIRELLKRALERFGYRVLVASSGEEALVTAMQHGGQIDLLITDVVMPKMNGHDLAESLCQLRPEMSVLYMSGYDEEMIASQGLQNSQFLQKPFSPKDIGKKIREVLR